MKNKLRHVALLSAMLLVFLTACAPSSEEFAHSDDILTQTVIPQGKEPITILVKYAFSIDTFEKAVEEKFPDIDIIQVGNFTCNSGLAEYDARME
ncbi:MAG: multiple sugar-binding protein, partial [Oscillospiraceae bacterium]